ncbi:DUF554 domain-containing protein [Tessaracoccus antarcticus]|uniref:DUF554 domain-containing protein n=1 Tax=Tessaracoccus antarcticus TaxID=2479848 RepID=A0A3M0GBS9_9ACTN|nr:DUF554 domain-containing protein [Tessaracoccus antarcticus]RMB62280.1 DUF554 domain-containing protein [Tessaracoccus antarcticus]
MFIGFGTVVNVLTVLAGASLGLLIGNRLPERTRTLVTDCLGLVTIVIGIFACLSMTSDAVTAQLGAGVGLLVVLGSLLPGALLGSWLRLTERLEGGAEKLRGRFAATGSQHFVEGIITPVLVFCVGPLTIMGSISDGLGLGSQQLLVKSVLDGFASIAFAASLGVGVLFSAGAVGVIQGGMTLAAFLLGGFLAPAQVDLLEATGGVILIGLGLRLLDLRKIRVADMLPALVIAPVLTWVLAPVLG